MSTVEDRILAMKFDNRSFESGVKTTLSTLDRLKASLNFSSASRGLTDLQSAGNKFNLNHLSDSVDTVASRFTALGTIGITTLATITSRAVSAGLNFSKAFTLGPISAGFSDFNAKLTSVQTIVNATGRDLEEVNGFFTQLDVYADKTVFNLSDMTGALAKFTNAGVKLETSIPAIKGIANMTALAGQGADAAGIAFYNLSQSIGNGFMTTSDFRSLNLANVATKEWKDNMVKGAIAAGTLKQTGKDTFKILADGSGKAVNSAQLFTDELSRGWASAKVLTDVLGKYGDTQTAIGKKAQAAAQDVKSLPMMIDTLKAAVGTSWTDTFEIVFGDLEESKKLFTGLTNSIGGFLGGIGDARNTLLSGWDELGGRTKLIKAFGRAFDAIGDIIHPIKLAFRDIFPATTAQDLFNITKNFLHMARAMRPNEQTMDNLRRTARGFFAVIDIGWMIIKGFIGVIGDLFGAMGDGSGSFLQFTGNIGDFLVAIHDAIESGEGLNNFFEGLGDILSIPIRVFGDLIALFTGATEVSDDMDAALGRMSERFGPLTGLVDILTGAWGIFANAMMSVLDLFGPVTDAIADAFSGLGDAIAGSMESGNFDRVLDVINTGLLAGILLLVKKFFSKGINVDLGGGMLSSIRGSFDQLTSSMKSMQTQIQAKTLLMIAGAIALLTASVVALSLIDSADLTKALAAMTVSFGQLLAAMGVLIKLSGHAGFVKVPIIAASMVLLAAAMVEMTAAIALMGQLKWETIGKGLTGIGGALVVIAAGMAVMPKGMLFQAVSLTILAAAINAIALAVTGFGLLSWEMMAKGLAGVTGALLAIGVAMRLMPKGMVLQAVALVAISGALVVLGGAIAALGLLGWKNIAKGLVALGGALVVLAAGLTLMNGTLLGALALKIAAKSLAILGAVIAGLGLLGWDQIGKGLLTLAAALTVIGIAGLLLAPVVLPLIGLGLALTAIGAGLALAGSAALAFATAFSIFTAAGTAGITIFTAMMTAVIKQIPAFMKSIGQGLIEIIKVIGRSGAAFVKAFTTILLSMIEAGIKVIPRFLDFLTILITRGLQFMRETSPQWIATAFFLLNEFMKQLAENVPQIARNATKFVVNIMNAMGDNADVIVQAGLDMILDFIDALGKAIEEYSPKFVAAGQEMSGHIAKGLALGLAQAAAPGAGLMGSAFSLGKSVIGAVGKAVGAESPSTEAMKIGRYVGDGFAIGLNESASVVERSADQMGRGALETIQVTMSKVAEALNGPMDFNPTISPILDLTRLQNEATKINGYLTTSPITAGVSFGQAAGISQAQVEAQAVEVTTPSVTTKEIKFEQNITSPKALSDLDIYRDTKSLLSLAKEALNAE